jgi:galactonate dehydratase
VVAEAFHDAPGGPLGLACTDGHVPALTGPGLGIEIDAAEVERAAKVGHRWRNPVWRRDDGALAEW